MASNEESIRYAFVYAGWAFVGVLAGVEAAVWVRFILRTAPSLVVVLIGSIGAPVMVTTAVILHTRYPERKRSPPAMAAIVGTWLGAVLIATGAWSVLSPLASLPLGFVTAPPGLALGSYLLAAALVDRSATVPREASVVVSLAVGGVLPGLSVLGAGLLLPVLAGSVSLAWILRFQRAKKRQRSVPTRA